MLGAALLFAHVALAADSHHLQDASSSGPDSNFESDLAAAFSHNNHFGWLETEFELAAGLRNDSLDWSIAGFMGGGSPNILSELSWSDLDSYQITLTNRSHFRKHIYLRGMGSMAWIRSGTVRDSDYGGDSRTDEWSRSVSDTDGDELYDISLGGGYSFFFLQERLSVSPLLGYSYHKQNLRITNGAQIVSLDNPFSGSPDDNPPALGPLSSQLDSTYRARWSGPWIGCDVRYRLEKRFPALPPTEVGLSVEFHWVDYYGEGNWNLRSDLAHPKSFEHEANGKGLNVNADCRIQLAAHWDLTMNLNLQEWTTSSGKDRKFLQNGGSVDTRLNKVSWESSSFMIGAVYRF